MSYLGVGVSPGNVAVYHGSDLKVIDRRVRLGELILRCVICILAVLASVLVATDTQVKQIFSIQKKAKFTDMRALVFLVVANGLVAAYSLVQILRCVVSMVRGSVLFNKPLAWAIFSGDQIMAYLTLAATASATQGSLFAKLGQPALQWMKICNVYGKFCNQISDGIASAIITTSKRLAERKNAKFEKNISRRGSGAENSLRKKLTVENILLVFFALLIVGSFVFQIIKLAIMAE